MCPCLEPELDRLNGTSLEHTRYVLDRLPQPQPSPLWLLRPGLIVVLILRVLTLLSPLWLFSPLLPSNTDFSLGHFSLLAFLQVSFYLRTSAVVYVATSKPVFLTNDPSHISNNLLMTSGNHPLDVFVSPKLNKLETPSPFPLTKSASFPGLPVSFQGATFYPHSNLLLTV